MSPWVCSVSKTELWIPSYWKCKQIEIIRLTSKNINFNESSFVKSETSIGFVVSKRVWEWSRISFLSPVWSYTQNKAKFLTINSQTVSKNVTFFTKDFKHRYIIYHWKVFFSMSMESRSLLQNKAPVGSDQLSKFRYFAEKSVSTIWHFHHEQRVPLWRGDRGELELAVGVAGDGGAMRGSHGVATRIARSATIVV